LYRQEFAPRFATIERDFKMRPNWEFREGKEPAEYIALSGEFEKRVTEITADTLRDYVEPVLAEMYERDPQGFQHIKQSGRVSLLGPDPGLPVLPA
jgi:hypothetical protein